MTLASAACLVLVHVVFSDAIFLFLRRLLRDVEGLSPMRIFVLSRGLGPAAVAASAYALLTFLPGRSPSFYAGSITALILVPGLLALAELPALVASYRGLFARIGQVWHRPKGLVSIIVLAALLAALFAVAIPLVEHDALSAAMETRIAVRDASLANFMAVREPDPETGYYMENFRTPFLQMLDAYFAWMLGRDAWDRPARWSSALFFVHGLALLAALLRRRHPERVVVWGCLLLAVTPIYFYMGYNNGIDTVRLYLLLVALAWIAELVRTSSRRVAIAAGMASGFALFAHLLAAPGLAWGGLVYLVKGRCSVRRRLSASAILLAIAFFAGAQYHYLMAPGLLEKLDRSFGVTRIATMLEPVPVRDTIEKRAARARKISGAVVSESIETAEKAAAKETSPPPSSVPSQKMSRSPSPIEQQEVALTAPSVAVAATEEPRLDKRASEEEAIDTIEGPTGLLAARGQGGAFFEQLVFGRLQMFTGIEYFGWLFWIAAAALVARVSRRQETSGLGLVMSGAVVLTALVVLSGVRKLSWSNPRYIATLIPMAAYLAAPHLASFEARLGRRRARTAAIVAALIFPVLLVTTIRGAKIEITNTGTFYSDFRSLRWVDTFVTDPRAALGILTSDYLGLRKTFVVLFSDDDTQLENAHDYFAATLWARDHLPEDAKILVFRDTRFFYYGRHKAVVWYSPELDQKQYQYYITRPAEMKVFLLEQGFTHVLVDDYSMRLPGYFDNPIAEMLQNRRLVRQVFELGAARVYGLLEAEDEDPPRRSTS